MVVVSVSLKDESLDQLREIQKGMGLSSRNETIRYCLKTVDSQMREREDMSGPVEGVLIVVHNSHMDSWMSVIQHRYERLVGTQLHSHLESGKCLEVMILRGDAEDVGNMIREFDRQENAEYVRFVQS